MATPITITDQDTRVDYKVEATPDDTFNIPFEFFDKSDIRVSVGGTEQTSGFTVTGNSVQNGFSDGTLTLDIAVSNTTVSIWRDIPISRTSVFPTSGEFSITSLNTQLARIVAMLQQEHQQFLRSVRLPEAEGGKLAELPAAADRTNRLLGFDADGQPIAASGSVSDVTVSSFSATLLDDTTAAEARGTLGAQDDLNVVPQAEAEAGTATTERIWTAQRAKQAMDALVPGIATPLIQPEAKKLLQLGQCRLDRNSATEVILNRHDGRYLFINGVAETIPDGGITADNTGLSANTTYYVYAYMDAGTMKLELSTTAPAQSTTYGHQIKTGDGTRTLVGRARTNGSTEFGAHFSADVTSVVSYFNRRKFIWDEFYIWQDTYGSEPGSSAVFDYIGNAVSSTFLEAIPFFALAEIEWARMTVIWATSNTNNAIRVVSADDGPSNLVSLAQVNGNGGGTPIKSYATITSDLQNLQKTTAFYKNIGFQYKRATSSQFDLYRVGIEFIYELSNDGLF
jgi:hypothetical protein